MSARLPTRSRAGVVSVGVLALLALLLWLQPGTDWYLADALAKGLASVAPQKAAALEDAPLPDVEPSTRPAAADYSKTSSVAATALPDLPGPDPDVEVIVVSKEGEPAPAPWGVEMLAAQGIGLPPSFCTDCDETCQNCTSEHEDVGTLWPYGVLVGFAARHGGGTGDGGGAPGAFGGGFGASSGHSGGAGSPGDEPGSEEGGESGPGPGGAPSPDHPNADDQQTHDEGEGPGGPSGPEVLSPLAPPYEPGPSSPEDPPRVASVPEPGTLLLTGLGAAALALLDRRRRH